VNDRTDRRDVVAIIQPFVPTYRVGFFDSLADELAQRGLRLEVWHDQPKGRVAARGNATTGSWSVAIRQRRVSVRGHNVTFRNVHRSARRVRAVVAGLASGNVETYALAADPGVHLMLWGHGRNFTADNNGVDARLESWLSGRSRHVFVYTPAGERHLLAAGLPPHKLTVVMNSTDSRAISAARDGATTADVAAARERWDLDGDHHALYVGAFDDSKRLPFLFEAADLIHAKLPSFRLVVAGAGPLDAWVADECARRSYVRSLGRVSESDLGLLARLVDVITMPGRIGLVAVDSLAMGVPIATTRHAFHAPEAEYLDDDVSLWTANEAAAYADGVAELLDDPDRLAELSAACLERSSSFSAEAAAARFAQGIDQALDTSAPRASTS